MNQYERTTKALENTRTKWKAYNKHTKPCKWSKSEYTDLEVIQKG